MNVLVIKLGSVRMAKQNHLYQYTSENIIMFEVTFCLSTEMLHKKKEKKKKKRKESP